MGTNRILLQRCHPEPAERHRELRELNKVIENWVMKNHKIAETKHIPEDSCIRRNDNNINIGFNIN